MTFPLDEFAASPDRMPTFVARFEADRAALLRQMPPPGSVWRHEMLTAFLADWQSALDALPFDEMTPADRADWLLFDNLLAAESRQLVREAALADTFPYLAPLLALEESRRRLENVNPEAAAQTLTDALPLLSQTPPSARVRTDLLTMLEAWFTFSDGYDPAFSWHVGKPYDALRRALDELKPDETHEPPIGRDALISELRAAQIDASPEELREIGRREWDWCRSEMKRAAGEMGMGDDWRAALEAVKNDHEPPGNQPALVRALAREAIAYVEENNLVTVPELAKTVWRMEMMTAERQKTSPFFLGGEAIWVSFPTADMEQSDKAMSLRGNNRHFSRATVQHELIPGHHLQMFAQERHRPYRRVFATPFWTEGWTLHWEMLLWERGWPRTPSEKIGMLFWRAHRAARVLFSLGYHLGEMTADECVEMLVAEVGHERANAEAEVKRSFAGDYPPLYQAAYLLGGLQVHALYRELTGAGMADREFHDRFLRENAMPIATLRALLLDLPLEKDTPPVWRFGSDPEADTA